MILTISSDITSGYVATDTKLESSITTTAMNVANTAWSQASSMDNTLSTTLTSAYIDADTSLSATLVENYTSAINDAVGSIPTYTLPAATVDSLGGVTLTAVSTIATDLDSTLSSTLVEDYTSMVTSIVNNLPDQGVTETRVSEIATSKDNALSTALTENYTSADNTLSATLVESYTSDIADAVSGLSNYTLPAATADSLGGVTLETISTIANAQAATSAQSVSSTLVEDYTSMITSVVTNMPSQGVAESTVSEIVSAANSALSSALVDDYTSMIAESAYVLPTATETSIGGIALSTVSNIASAQAFAQISTVSESITEAYTSAITDATSDLSNYTLPAATTDSLGGVTLSQISTIANTEAVSVVNTMSTTITDEYTSAIANASYVLPTATNDNVGGVALSTISNIASAEASAQISTVSVSITDSYTSAIAEEHASMIDYVTSNGGNYTLPEATETSLGGVTLSTISTIVLENAVAGYEGPFKVSYDTASSELICDGGRVYFGTSIMTMGASSVSGVINEAIRSACFYMYYESGSFYNGYCIHNALPSQATADQGFVKVLALVHEDLETSEIVVNQIHYGDIDITGRVTN